MSDIPPQLEVPDMTPCTRMIHHHPLPKGYVPAGEEADDRLANGWANFPCPDCGEGGWMSPEELAQYIPRIISTDEQVNSLPHMTVIREVIADAPSGSNYGRVFEKWQDMWKGIGSGLKHYDIRPPVVMLYTPETKPGEPQQKITSHDFRSGDRDGYCTFIYGDGVRCAHPASEHSLVEWDGSGGYRV